MLRQTKTNVVQSLMQADKFDSVFWVLRIARSKEPPCLEANPEQKFKYSTKLINFSIRTKMLPLANAGNAKLCVNVNLCKLTLVKLVLRVGSSIDKSKASSKEYWVPPGPA